MRSNEWIVLEEKTIKNFPDSPGEIYVRTNEMDMIVSVLSIQKYAQYISEKCRLEKWINSQYPKIMITKKKGLTSSEIRPKQRIK